MEKVPIRVQVVLYMGAVVLLAMFNMAGIHWVEKRCCSEGTGNAIVDDEGICSLSGKQMLVEVPVMSILDRNVTKGMFKSSGKVAYLTFDDGPSENTDKILDVLKEKGVKATFFVVGKTGEAAKARYRRIVEEGHTLGLHSYSHKYEEIYASLEGFQKDVLRLREYLYEVTGEEAWAYRFPGGSSNRVAKVSMKECIDFLNREGMVYFDWNASSEDAVEVNASCSVLNANILKDALRYERPMILMHDLHECGNTAEGLSELIDRLLEEGYEIEAITRETKPVWHNRN